MTDVPATPHWRVFLQALADEVDSQGGAAARDELLRGIGRRMAKLRPIVTVAGGVDLLVDEINELLSGMGWGFATIRVDDDYPALVILHTGLPRIGATGEPTGTWLSAVLEGLYQGWLAQLPGGDAGGMVVRRESVMPRTITLRYGRRTAEPAAVDARRRRIGPGEADRDDA